MEELDSHQRLLLPTEFYLQGVFHVHHVVIRMS